MWLSLYVTAWGYAHICLHRNYNDPPTSKDCLKDDVVHVGSELCLAKAGCLFCTKRSADWRSVEGWSILHSSNRFEKLLKLSIKLFRHRCKHHRQKSSIRKCARTLATLHNAIVKRPCSLSAHLLHNALPCCSSLKHSAEDISARTAAQLGLFLPWHSLVSTQSLLCTLCQPLICEIPGLPSSGSRDNVGLQDCAQISYSRLKKTTTPELQMPRIC